MKNFFYKLILFSAIPLLSACGKSPLFSPLKGETPKGSQILALQGEEGFSFGKNGQRFGLQWISSPEVGSNSPLNLKFWDSSSRNFLGPYTLLENELCAFLWMVMPDGSEHGSSPIELGLVESENGNYYHLDQVYFIMPGNWQLRIRSVAQSSDCRGYKSDPYLEERIIEVPLQ